MYTVSKVSNDVYCLHAVELGWGASKHSWYYFNVVKRLKSDVLKRPESAPMLAYEMTDGDVDWATKHYIPKAQQQEDLPC